MQKRFCTCGGMVLVEYLSKNGKWVPVFITEQNKCTHSKIFVATCPSCGTPINIHALR